MSENHLDFRSENGKRKILVVEDEAINRDLLELILQDDYDIIFAQTGEEALEHIRKDHDSVSIVLLDLNLPDMSGIDVLRELKEDHRTSMIPIIVMTADQEAEVECLTLGAIDFIPKPYPQPKVILARILRTIELSENRDIIRWTERDHLTGLYNREYFYRYAEQYDTHHKDTPTDAIVLDINHFHMFNERYGRNTGDELLKKIAEKLLETVSSSGGIASRKGGDTFLLYCPHRSDYDEILNNAAVEISEGARIRIRMGVYSNTDKTIDIERRFDRAKLAADMIKGSFSSSVSIYDNSLHEEEVLADQLLDGFHTAIAEKQFSVFFQPKFDVRSREPLLSSAEALVRWKHPALGMVSPGVFIPLFEKNGLIRELDSYVWRETAGQIKAWREKLGQSIPVSVNISRIDLYDPDLTEELETIVSENGLSHGDLYLEITESAYTENAEQIISVVNGLRDRGFHIEMDDFGSGYSSLNMLTSLPIDVLKLDMQFIRTAFRKRKDTRLLEAVIDLAKSMGFTTVAEGVETAEQMFTLKSMGCDFVQGYYFSRPLPAEDFENYIISLNEPGTAEDSPASTVDKTGPSDKYTYEAMHDPLTGLYNQSAFDILFHDSDHEHIAVMLAHIDDYREICGEYGKPYANQVIKRVAEVLKKSFRSVDNICHLQEAEFVIIMSRMTSSMQERVFEKIEQINKTLGEAPEGQIPVSLSVGIAFSDRQNPQGSVFTDAETALHLMEVQNRRGYSVY